LAGNQTSLEFHHSREADLPDFPFWSMPRAVRRAAEFSTILIPRALGAARLRFLSVSL
jgi:hypothetical protein